MSVLTNEIVRVDLIAQFDGDEDVINVFQFRNSGISQTDNTLVLDDLIALMLALVTALKAIITTLQVFQRIRVQNISTGEVLGERAFAAPIAGTGTANALPSQIACVTVFKTGIPNVNLRKFWGVNSLAQVDNDGDVTAGSIAVEVTVAAFLLTQYVGVSTDWDYGYLSPKTATFLLPNIAVISNAFGTQRRRREGVGS